MAFSRFGVGVDSWWSSFHSRFFGVVAILWVGVLVTYGWDVFVWGIFMFLYLFRGWVDIASAFMVVYGCVVEVKGLIPNANVGFLCI